jgi:hypothetical protein
MKNRIPWTRSRIILLVSSIFFIIVTIIGLGFNSVGNDAMKQQTGNGEDWSGVFGFGFQLFGQSLAVAGGILALSFLGLYAKVTRHLKRQS